MIIRDLKPSDFDDIVNNLYSYYEEVSENPELGLVLFNTKPSISYELEWFSNLYKGIAAGNNVAVVAEVDSHAVGLCIVHGRLPDSEISHGAELGIALRKEYRGRGIGTPLLREALERCRGKFETVELAVLTNNRAKKLYEKFGFKIIGTRQRAIKRGNRYFDEYVMILTL